MENEVSPENWNIFDKMKNDSCGNVVMLTNGLWFVAYNIGNEYEKGSKTWIEFSECNIDDSVRDILDYKKDISKLYIRRIAVPISSIAFIAELDS